MPALAGLSADAGTVKELLAPTGSLRVGVYPGSPTSMVVDPATRQSHGLTYDLGQEFASRLKVPAEYVTFQRVADVISAMKNGEVDFTVTNATPARANDVSFSPTLVSVELGYLVPANSSIAGPTEGRPGDRGYQGHIGARTAGQVPNARSSCRKLRLRFLKHVARHLYNNNAIRNVGFDTGHTVLDEDSSTWPSQFRRAPPAIGWKLLLEVQTSGSRAGSARSRLGAPSSAALNLTCSRDSERSECDFKKRVFDHLFLRDRHRLVHTQDDAFRALTKCGDKAIERHVIPALLFRHSLINRNHRNP